MLGIFPVFCELWRKRILRGWIPWTRIPALYDSGLTQEFRHWRSFAAVSKQRAPAFTIASRNPSRVYVLRKRGPLRTNRVPAFRSVLCSRGDNVTMHRDDVIFPCTTPPQLNDKTAVSRKRASRKRTSWKFVCSEWQGDCTCHAALRNRDVNASNVMCHRSRAWSRRTFGKARLNAEMLARSRRFPTAFLVGKRRSFSQHSVLFANESNKAH